MSQDQAQNVNASLTYKSVAFCCENVADDDPARLPWRSPGFTKKHPPCERLRCASKCCRCEISKVDGGRAQRRPNTEQSPYRTRRGGAPIVPAPVTPARTSPSATPRGRLI